MCDLTLIGWVTLLCPAQSLPGTPADCLKGSSPLHQDVLKAQFGDFCHLCIYPLIVIYSFTLACCILNNSFKPKVWQLKLPPTALWLPFPWLAKPPRPYSWRISGMQAHNVNSKHRFQVGPSTSRYGMVNFLTTQNTQRRSSLTQNVPVSLGHIWDQEESRLCKHQARGSTTFSLSSASWPGKLSPSTGSSHGSSWRQFKEGTTYTWTLPGLKLTNHCHPKWTVISLDINAAQDYDHDLRELPICRLE